MMLCQIEYVCQCKCSLYNYCICQNIGFHRNIRSCAPWILIKFMLYWKMAAILDIYEDSSQSQHIQYPYIYPETWPLCPPS